MSTKYLKKQQEVRLTEPKTSIHQLNDESMSCVSNKKMDPEFESQLQSNQIEFESYQVQSNYESNQQEQSQQLSSQRNEEANFQKSQQKLKDQNTKTTNASELVKEAAKVQNQSQNQLQQIELQKINDQLPQEDLEE